MFSPAVPTAPSHHWIARATLVLALSLLAHAGVLVLGHRALDGRLDEYGPTALIEARLIAPPAPEPVATPAPKPAPARRRAVVPPPAPVEAAPAPAPPAVPEEPIAELPAPPIELTPPAQTANSERPLPDVEAPIEAEFDASGATLLADVDRPQAQRAALPISARYVYQTTDTRYTAVTGTTTVRWRFNEDNSYTARLVTTVFGLPALELASTGRVHRFGLAPDRYTEKTISRSEWATNFDWDARRMTFSMRDLELELNEGTQDRLSFQFQLMTLGQRLSHRFRPGSAVTFPVGGRDGVEQYRFEVLSTERLQTGVGELTTVRIERRRGGDGAQSRIEVWLASDIGWLPVKLRFTDRRGQVTESLLSEATIPVE